MMKKVMQIPITQGNKITYHLAFDLYPGAEDFEDVIIPDDDPEIPPGEEYVAIVYDGGDIGIEGEY